MPKQTISSMYNVPAFYRGPVRGDTDLFRQTARVGESAPDFTIHTLDGQHATLSSLIGNGYVVLEFGSITCPTSVMTLTRMDHVAQAYTAIGVTFAFIYVRESNPGSNYTDHRSFKQKIQHAATLRDIYGMSRTIWVDDLAGTVHLLYGGINSMAYIINGDGLVTFREYPVDPDLLAEKLYQFVVDDISGDSDKQRRYDYYESVYYEGVLRRLLKRQEIVKILGYNGPEAFDEWKTRQNSERNRGEAS